MRLTFVPAQMSPLKLATALLAAVGVAGLAAVFPAGAAAAAAPPPPPPAAAPAPPAAATHPFGAVDLQSMLRVSSPQASGNGGRVVFLVRASDFTANRGKTDLWIVSSAGGDAHPLTNDGAGYDNPRWSPQGDSVFVLSSRSGSSQIWRLDLQASPSGEWTQMTHLPVDVTSFALSPAGTAAIVSADVFPDCTTLQCTHDRLAAQAQSKVKAHLYPDGGGFVRHWDVWEDGTRSHLFFVPLLPQATAGEPADLMHGMAADSPSKPEGGPEEYTFTPDGKSVVFAARDAGRQEPWSTNFDLFEVPLDASSTRRNLTTGNPAADTYPAFSPDGRWLAYAAQARPGFESDRYHIVLRNLATGEEHRLAETWDHSTGPLLFSADGKTLFTTSDDTGQTPLFAIDLASGHVAKLVTDGHADAPALLGADRLVFSRDDLRHPAELYTVRRDGSGLTQITQLNHDRLAAVRFGEPEQFHFPGAGGDTVYGWAVKPVDYVAGRRYPVAFIIHGGPQGSINNHFHYRWNLEVFAAAGYGVVAIDFHGSTGYGQKFTDAIREDWGGKPLEDLRLGLAAALARFSWMDGGRACALGASYGGFMVNWIAGNWNDGFRCLVDHDGIFDQRMMYYSTEELWFPEWEMGGPYWEQPAMYESWNPARFVDRWRTPELVVQGSLDYRIPVTQGLATFAALQRRGIPSELLVFQQENHWVLKPADSLLWHQTVLAWLARWTGESPAAAAPAPRP